MPSTKLGSVKAPAHIYCQFQCQISISFGIFSKEKIICMKNHIFIALGIKLFEGPNITASEGSLKIVSCLKLKPVLVIS